MPSRILSVSASVVRPIWPLVSRKILLGCLFRDTLEPSVGLRVTRGVRKASPCKLRRGCDAGAREVDLGETSCEGVSSLVRAHLLAPPPGLRRGQRASLTAGSWFSRPLSLSLSLSLSLAPSPSTINQCEDSLPLPPKSQKASARRGPPCPVVACGPKADAWAETSSHFSVPGVFIIFYLLNEKDVWRETSSLFC